MKGVGSVVQPVSACAAVEGPASAIVRAAARTAGAAAVRTGRRTRASFV
ncbi:hypothetical protein ACFHW2_19130 [Actinomadura sp. LOL_016]